MEYVGPGRLDHIGPEQSPKFPVRCMSRENGSVEWVTMEFALNRLDGYYDEAEDFVETTLRSGVPMGTFSFIYQMGGDER